MNVLTDLMSYLGKVTTYVTKSSWPSPAALAMCKSYRVLVAMSNGFGICYLTATPFLASWMSANGRETGSGRPAAK